MKRSEFIKNSILAALSIQSTLIIGNTGCNLNGGKTSNNGIFSNFGIQLWTVRDIIKLDPKATIIELSKFGFTQIESYEGGKGIYWGMKPKEFAQLLQDHGMELVSTHCDWTKDLSRKADELSSVGGKYLVCPYIGQQKSIDEFKIVSDKFNVAGEICKNAGVRFAYHNHDYSFQTVEGKIPQDVMMENTDADLVDFEMDMYWVVTAKADPETYLKRYKDRFRLCHIKDRIKNTEESVASCTLGEGIINYPKILKVAKENGMKYYIYEQERYDNNGTMDNAKYSANYLKLLQKR